MNKTQGLFSPSEPDATQQKKLDEISRLRALARHFLDRHNTLVERYWALERQANNAIDKYEQARTAERKNTLEKKITNKKYDKQYQQVIESAMRIEIEVYGHSDLSSSSFFNV